MNKLISFRHRLRSGNFEEQILININQSYGIGFTEDQTNCNTIFIDYNSDRYELKNIARLTNKQKEIFINTYISFLSEESDNYFDINKTMEDVFKWIQ